MTSRCAECSKVLPKNSNSQRKYCSDNCRKLASKKRRKASSSSFTVLPPVAQAVIHEYTEHQDTQAQNIGVPSAFEADLLTYEDLLRLSLRALQDAVRDQDTPAQAMAALTKQLLAVGKELDDIRREKEQDVLTDEGVDVSGSDYQPFDTSSI